MSMKFCRAATLLGVWPCLTGCDPGPDTDPYTHLKGEIFATHYRIAYLDGPDASTVHAAVKKELRRIDWMASTWKPGSELMRYNRAPDRDTFELSTDLKWLLKRSAEIREWTHGAFDIGFDGAQLDLSAIAKGYAVDRVSDILADDFGITSCLVDIGGEIKVRGNGPKGESWNVGLYIPGPPGAPAARTPRIQLRDSSIATSGTYFKGEHLIDPRTGRPMNHGLISASVIHPSNTTADALATALFVMGPEEGMKWAQQEGVHALFILRDGKVMEHRPQ